MSTEPRFTPGDWVATRVARGARADHIGVDLYEVGTKHVRVAENCTKADALGIAKMKKLYAACFALIHDDDPQRATSLARAALLEIHEPLGERV